MRCVETCWGFGFEAPVCGLGWARVGWGNGLHWIAVDLNRRSSGLPR